MKQNVSDLYSQIQRQAVKKDAICVSVTRIVYCVRIIYYPLILSAIVLGTLLVERSIRSQKQRDESTREKGGIKSPSSHDKSNKTRKNILEG
jgi:hypothetical protein